jgi:pimeloyl-ACP methyl ester carboxylesterase
MSADDRGKELASKMNGTIDLTAESSQLNTVVKGEGKPPVVILHGWAQSLRTMVPIAELLSHSRQVHLIDLPGFGASPMPPADWDTKQYAARVLKYLEDMKLDKVDLLGHSFGGRISVRIAANNPQALRSLILIGAHGMRLPQPFPKNIRAKILKPAAQWCKWLDRSFGMDLFESWFVPRYGSRDYKNAGAMRNILVKTVNEDLSGEARQIKVPTLLLWGEADQETPIALGKRYHELIVNSKLVALPGKDHLPFVGEGAHLCAYHILNYLNSLPETEKAVVNA